MFDRIFYSKCIRVLGNIEIVWNIDVKYVIIKIYLVTIFHQLNPFLPNTPFLYPLKTSENRKVFWCFQEVGKACIGNKWVKAFKSCLWRNETSRLDEWVVRILCSVNFKCLWLVVEHYVVLTSFGQSLYHPEAVLQSSDVQEIFLVRHPLNK